MVLPLRTHQLWQTNRCVDLNKFYNDDLWPQPIIDVINKLIMIIIVLITYW